MTNKKYKPDEKYKPDKKGVIMKYGGIFATGIIAGGGLLVIGGCSSKSEQWAETSGQAGHINLEAVEDAMKKSKDVTEFEKKVNEIYQGDEMVLIEVKNEAKGEQLVSGYADLNDNGKIDYDNDEKLFTFRRWSENGAQRGSMQGYGVNSYYNNLFPAGMNFLTTWMLFSALSRPMYSVPMYQTTMGDAQGLRNYRSTYRGTPSYRDQINTNRQFESRMSSTHGTNYKQASPGASRQRWASQKGINLSKATNIASGSKGWGKTGSRGFFRGGGAGGGIVYESL
jgi:hypothetical protein